uniref:Uncharacterized protein n=1 Tax=Picea glauca TaxID=3330 RepID=A0A117NFU5_PICGL|nr:hypothetical protein ABT39_MTgene2306 [Picea glauca]QHR89281.1 hypothetical protein Q903MT_gene3302 [Picea sitchensis]
MSNISFLTRTHHTAKFYLLNFFYFDSTSHCFLDQPVSFDCLLDEPEAIDIHNLSKLTTFYTIGLTLKQRYLSI